MSFPCIGVVADDLPGAIASGARLRAAGHRTAVVTLGRKGWPGAPEAIVVNAGTRELVAGGDATAADAADRVRAAAERLRRTYKCRRFELRVDAALRRDYSAEVDALVAGTGLQRPLVLAAPAFPSAGRLTEHGRQLAFVSKGEEREVEVSSVLFAGHRSATIPLRTVHRGVEAVAQAVRDASARRIVFDAKDEEDLRIVAGAVASLEQERGVVTISSGAWLRFRPLADVRRSFVLVAMGLPTEPNEQQLQELLEGDRTRLMLASQAVQISVDQAEFESCVEAVDTIVVKAEGEPTDDRARLLAADEVAAAVESLLAISHRTGVGCRGVVGTGAYTAARVVDALKARVITPFAEVSPLCPMGFLSGGPWTGLPVVMKGGLVGTSSTLVDIVQQLRLMPQTIGGYDGAGAAR